MILFKRIGWIVFTLSSIFTLHSCINQAAPNFEGVYTCTDTLEFKTTQRISANQVFLYTTGQNAYFIYPVWEKNRLLGINIESPNDSLIFEIPFQSVCKFGYWDIQIVNKDSIFLIPDHRGENVQELVLISGGVKLASYNIDSSSQVPAYNYSGTHLNRLDYYHGILFSNIFYQDYIWHQSGKMSNPEMFQYPHHSRYSVKDDSLNFFGYYPEKLTSGELAHGLVLKTRIDSTIIFCYMYQHELHVYNTNDLSDFRKIDLAEALDSKTKGEALYKTERELLMQSDLIQYIVYNAFQERLYLVYTPAIAYKKEGGLEVANWTDKKQILHVFTKDLVHLGSIEFPLDKGFELSGAFPIKEGLLCTMSESSQTNPKYIKVEIP
jgi:hypothetical protein